MEFSPTPTTIALILAIVAGIVYIVRIESKTNSALRDIEDLYIKQDTHVADKEIHSDRAESNLKFAMLNSTIANIKHLVEKLDERLRRFLEK
jgi:hypothetical protein